MTPARAGTFPVAAICTRLYHVPDPSSCRGKVDGGVVARGGLDGGGISAARAGSLKAMSLVGKKVGIASPVDVEVLNYTYKYIKLEAAAPGNGESIVVVDANGNSITQHSQ